MGVNLRGLVEPKILKVEELQGRAVAFDGNNVLYQFLSSIRGADGQPLRDREGRITSHLSGLLYRNSNLLEKGVRVAYVFDGEPHLFKREELETRMKARAKARVLYERAVEEGDAEKARLYGQRAVVATGDLVAQAKRLLSCLGIPWVQAPGEGEAQAAYMAKKGDVWAAASQDYDSLLFGAPRHIRNLSITGRRKLPRKKLYINVEPELIELERLKQSLGLTQSQLVDVGILVGTDYNPKGVKGIGPKTALKLIKKHGSLEAALPHIKSAEFPHPVEEIRELFLNPPTTDEYQLKWEPPKTDALVEFLCEEHNFNRQRVLAAVERAAKGLATPSKTTLDRFFG